MQIARYYIDDTSDHIKKVFHHMPMLPTSALATRHVRNITPFVEELLTPKEQAMCDMATD